MSIPFRKSALIHLVAGARPNFMKIAPLYRVLEQEEWALPLIVHTGQHYDYTMSRGFFRDLGLPEPHLELGVGSGTHGEQTGKIMIAYEKLLMERPPELVVVVGDVNSSLGAALAAVKLGIKVVHLEAGLRSFDRSMPEEINRIVVDSVAELLLTPSPDADRNLLREGISANKIVRVGNIMMDSIEMLRPRIERALAYAEYGLPAGNFGLVTLHRPSNVDDRSALRLVLETLVRIAEKTPLVFPLHPRTRKSLMGNGYDGILRRSEKILTVDPLPYIRFMSLLFASRFVITDSGGLQEETTYLGIPCLTVRPNTERPITVEQGTNRLSTPASLEEDLMGALSRRTEPPPGIDLWDGETSSRAAKALREALFPS